MAPETAASRSGKRPSRLKRLGKLLCLAFLLAVIGLAVFWGGARYAGHFIPGVPYNPGEGLYAGRTPSELIRYAKRRLYGHTRLERVALPIIDTAQQWYERPVPSEIDTLGKGQKKAPVEIELLADILVANADELAKAMRAARAGQTIEILPGEYRIQKRLETGRAGTPAAPITVRAADIGTVTLLIAASEGIKFTKPHWIIENISFRGVCTEDRYCDHAFHVVGAAAHTTIRNNHVQDFNAHVKVNGEGGTWPDDGLLQFNTLTNTRPRNTTVSVTPFDLVGANGWRVEDNLVTHFVKSDGNKVAYGLFMKGNSQGGVIERNLVICSPQDISAPGVRVGISFGGGGTGQDFCRDKDCRFEHRFGRIANNVVAHCNDFGIDAVKAEDVQIAFNTLINTSGIDIRGRDTTARVFGNLLEGTIRSRDGATIAQEKNEITNLSKLFVNADALRLAWPELREPVATPADVLTDFCEVSRGAAGFLGATSSRGGC